GVEDLDEGCAPVGALVDLAAGLCGQEDERRPDLLPFLPDNITRDEVDERDLRFHRTAEIPVKRLKLGLYGPDDLLEVHASAARASSRLRFAMPATQMLTS